jgi:hypothetical protein
MAAVAKLSEYPDRSFKSRYWEVPGGPTIYAYVSEERQPLLVAIDLHDVPSNPVLEGVTATMRLAQIPFRDAREVRAGVHGRFLVAVVGA